MKMFKRFAAALLAGVMVLAMLTACGGSGAGNSNATEKRILDAFNKAGGTAYSNDAGLQTKARAVLNKVDENGQIKSADLPYYEEGGVKIPFVEDVQYNKTTGDISMVVIMAVSRAADENTYQAIEVTEESLKQMESSDPGSLDWSDEEYKTEAVGIATRTLANGKTYMAIALKISGNYNG